MTDNIIFDKYPSLVPLKDEISRRIGDSYRIEHTLSVACECLALADIFDLGEDEKKQIVIASLLHDIAKGLSTYEFKALDEKYSVGFTDDDFASPAVLHAKAGAKIAELEFADYSGKDICAAIETHTTGGENMSLMAKLSSSQIISSPRENGRYAKKRESLFTASLQRSALIPARYLTKL
jgi:HD superfamily phosphohydrolase